jgi:hypothetical protein
MDMAGESDRGGVLRDVLVGVLQRHGGLVGVRRIESI